jgi:hypothetical protein
MTVPTCESCAHYRVDRHSRGDLYEYDRRCEVKVYDPVTGQMGEPDPLFSRTHDRYCGLDGKFWRQR